MLQKRMEKYLDSKWYAFFLRFYCVFIVIVIIFSADIPGPFHSLTNNISDSMDPVIDRKSLTIVRSLSAYEVGDIITYYALIDGRTEVITHRVTSSKGNVYTTKGDANEVADRELVKPRLVMGKVILIIPYLGLFISIVKSFLGTWFFIILPALMIISAEGIRIILELEKKGNEKEN
jgi:signal peptidase I